ncbi:MAG: formylglycine-generating enzyme family protein [Pseudomonadota bacterium]
MRALWFVVFLALVGSCSGSSIEQDSSAVADSSAPDAGTDLLAQDLAQDVAIVDGPIADLPLPDVLPDSISPDLQFPDLTSSDLLLGFDSGPLAGIKFVTISPGIFSMGAPPTETCYGSQPFVTAGKETQHSVRLSNGFEIMTTEVTVRHFLSEMGYDPVSVGSVCAANDCPVRYITWHEAAAFCNKLSAKKGYAQCYACTGTGAAVNCSEAAAYGGVNVYRCPGYRLPTEAEFEYAYRAGTSTALYNGSISNCMASDPNADLIAWYHSNSGNQPHPVAQKQPNSWGLYDMAGNVYEYCHDRFEDDLGSAAATDPWGSATSNERVLRGGSYYFVVKTVRAAHRCWVAPNTTSYSDGFRVARTK